MKDRLDQKFFDGHSDGRSCEYRAIRAADKNQLIRDEDSLPERQGMRKPYGWEGREYENLNFEPLRRFLRSKVGQPWNKVYSELHEKIDVRTYGGHRVMEELRWMVDTGEHAHHWYRTRGLYVDENGILCKKDYSTRWRQEKDDPTKPKKVREHVWNRKTKRYDYVVTKITFHKDGGDYEQINGIWYGVEYAYRKAFKNEVRRIYDEETKEWDWRSVPVPYQEQFIQNKHQLNKKELKKLGLSNDRT